MALIVHCSDDDVSASCIQRSDGFNQVLWQQKQRGPANLAHGNEPIFDGEADFLYCTSWESDHAIDWEFNPGPCQQKQSKLAKAIRLVLKAPARLKTYFETRREKHRELRQKLEARAVQRAMKYGSRRSGFRSMVIRQPNQDIGEVSCMRVGDYKLGSWLGAGGFGFVFATSSKGNDAAIKVLDKSRITTFRELKRTNLEIGIMMDHGWHTNIMGLLDFMHASANLYLVMPRATADLRTLCLKKTVFQDQPDCLQQIMLGILEATKYLHERGICHRDLKPENVLLCTSSLDYHFNLIPGRRLAASDVRLSDFGLAAVSKRYKRRDNNEHDSQSPSYANGLPRKHDIILDSNDWAGTTYFAAPETFLEPLYEGRRTDLWSLGVLLMDAAGLMTTTWLLLQDHLRNDDMVQYKTRILMDLQWAKEHVPEDLGLRLVHDLALQHFLLVDASERLSSTQALQHPWFKFQYPQNLAEVV